ncbi:MAG: hypothetical protein ACREJ0_01800 [Geminicoccaceae bacterium]
MVVLHADVEHPIVEALGEERTVCGRGLPLANDPAHTAACRDVAQRFDTESIPEVIPEERLQLVGHANFVALNGALREFDGWRAGLAALVERRWIDQAEPQ